MKNKWKSYHPATLFIILTLIIILVSWICDIYGLSVNIPSTGENIRVQSLLSSEGIRWWLRNVINNFTEFAPLGMAIIAMFGVGIALHSGFVKACIRLKVGGLQKKQKVIGWIIALGLLSNAIGDGGYIILLPIAAILFKQVGLPPITGIITSYISVACGYSANIVLSTMDPLLAHITQEAALETIGYQGNTEPLCNYFFMAISTIVIAFVIYWITVYILIPALSKSQNEVLVEEHRSLSRKERRALIYAITSFAIYMTFILWLTFSPYGILRGVNGGLMHSPFIAGILFIISLGIGISGLIYGIVSGKYRSDGDIVVGIMNLTRSLGEYFVIVFFAAQMFACFEYSSLDKYLLVITSKAYSFTINDPFMNLIVFILLISIINLIMVSATSKWAIISYILIPIFYEQGIEPDIVQCAFRIGDSSTNAITPFLFYMPLVLTYMRQYDKNITYIFLLKYTWKYSLIILTIWILLFIIWLSLRLPVGL